MFFIKNAERSVHFPTHLKTKPGNAPTFLPQQNASLTAESGTKPLQTL